MNVHVPLEKEKKEKLRRQWSTPYINWGKEVTLGLSTRVIEKELNEVQEGA